MGKYITFDGGSGVGKGMIIGWFENHLKSHDKRVFVLSDKRLDPLRDLGVMMIPWCEENNVKRQTFLLPLFVAGGKIVGQELEKLLTEYDFVLRDRSFVSSLAYEPAAGMFTPEQIWSLYVTHMGFRVPDLSVIVDAHVDVALNRIGTRVQHETGLGGHMSGDSANRQRIRDLFLSLPEKFGNRMPIIVVSNNERISPDNENAIEDICRKILSSMSSNEVTFNQFADAFRANIQARSRTAKGVSDTKSSSTKKKLLKSDEELRKQVEDNTENLIRLVWQDAHEEAMTPERVRHFMERWCDTINSGLVAPDMYEEEQKLLRIHAEKLQAETNLPYRINPRYRVWSVSYTSLNLSPVQLELSMDSFYEELCKKIYRVRMENISQAELLAYADHMIDAGIHPWADGCGRSATAAVMWLSLLVPWYRLPIFRDRDTHYSTIHEVPRHTAYFEECLGCFLHNGA